MEKRTAILVIDGHPIVRYALREFLAGQPRVEVVAEASSIGQGLEAMKISKPDVIITELIFAETDGLDAVWTLIREAQVGVIAFSDQDTWDLVDEFVNHGGMGFVSKRSPLPELASAVRAVAGRQTWIAPSLRSVAQVANRPSMVDCGLTSREREVVTLIAKGFTSKQIADQLCVSLKTVETHRYHVFKKLKIRRIAQLTDYAIRNGLSSGPVGRVIN